MPAKSLQSGPTLGNPTDCSLPGSFILGLLQARILEWVAIPFSWEFSQSRDQTCISCIGKQILYCQATWEAHDMLILKNYLLVI